jgi:CelD/BcsL family acetyltransferase involved in cellulose biosynthesis
MMDIETITCREDLPLANDRWQALCRRCGSMVPYLAPEWYSSALETVDRDKEPLLVFFRQGGEDVGLAPLVHGRGQGALRFLHLVGFVSNPFTPYQGILHAADLPRVFDRLVRLLGQMFGARFLLDLNEMRLGPDEIKALGELSTRGGLFSYRLEHKAGSRYLVLKESFEENFRSLSKHTQKEFRRKINRISRLGQLGLLKVSGREQVERHLDRFFALYARTWKGAERHPGFYYRLCPLFESRGMLHFHALTLNGRPIAYLISILSGDTLYGIKTTYDPSFSAYSPGVLLFYKVIEDIFTMPGVREFDIGRGDEQFKREWTSTIHGHVRMWCYPSNPVWKGITSLRYELLPRWKENERFNACYSLLRKIARQDGGDGHALSAAGPGHDAVPQDMKRYEYGRCAQDESTVEARLANAGDLDLLTVAMAARSFAEVQQRLEKELCVLCFEGRRLLAFFWLRWDAGGQDGGGLPAYLVSEWGASDGQASRSLQNALIPSVLAFLKTTISRPDCAVLIDEQGCRSFEPF